MIKAWRIKIGNITKGEGAASMMRKRMMESEGNEKNNCRTDIDTVHPKTDNFKKYQCITSKQLLWKQIAWRERRITKPHTFRCRRAIVPKLAY